MMMGEGGGRRVRRMKGSGSSIAIIIASLFPSPPPHHSINLAVKLCTLKASQLPPVVHSANIDTSCVQIVVGELSSGVKEVQAKEDVFPPKHPDLHLQVICQIE